MICATFFIGKMEVELLNEQGRDGEILHQFKLVFCDFCGSVCYCSLLHRAKRMLQNPRMADTHY